MSKTDFFFFLSSTVNLFLSRPKILQPTAKLQAWRFYIRLFVRGLEIRYRPTAELHADSYIFLPDKNIFNIPAEGRRHKNKRSLPFYCSLIKQKIIDLILLQGGGDIKRRGLLSFFLLQPY